MTVSLIGSRSWNPRPDRAGRQPAGAADAREAHARRFSVWTGCSSASSTASGCSRSRTDAGAAARAAIERPERQLSRARRGLAGQARPTSSSMARSWLSRGRDQLCRLQQRMQLDDPERARRAGWRSTTTCSISSISGPRPRRLPLRARKRLLQRSVRLRGRLRFTTHRNADGEAYLREACRKGWEGLIAKRADAQYVHHRSTDWLKLKCCEGRSWSSAGAPIREARRGLRRAALGYYRAAGCATPARWGPGSTTRRSASRRRLRKLGRKSSPFADDVRRSPRLGATGARGRDRVHRMDGRGPAAPPPLPRPEARQGPRRSSASGRRRRHEHRARRSPLDRGLEQARSCSPATASPKATSWSTTAPSRTSCCRTSPAGRW